MQLLQYGYPNYYRTMGRNLKADDFNRFISNRIIIQQAMQSMGVRASDEGNQHCYHVITQLFE